MSRRAVAGHALRRPEIDGTEPALRLEPVSGDLRAFCKAHLANFKVPKQLLVRDALPMLPIGKVDKVALREAALEEPARKDA